jgi:hypothetical protein
MAFTLENACNELRPASLPMDGRLFSFKWLTTGRLEKVLPVLPLRVSPSLTVFHFPLTDS